MKKLVLLSVAALMLASTVFAPIAMAREPDLFTIQPVTYQPESEYNLPVTVTFQCTEGGFYFFDVGVYEGPRKPDQSSLKDKKRISQAAFILFSGRCETTGPQTVTAQLGLGQPPLTKQSKVWAFAAGDVCYFPNPPPDPTRICNEGFDFERVKIL